MLNITGFRIKKLFGTLDHAIDFKDGGLTFIHGPNGSGKTTALRLLELALTSDFSAIKNIIFSTLEIDFSDKTTIEIIRKSNFHALSDASSEDYEDEPNEHVEIFISHLRNRKQVVAPSSISEALNIAEIRAQVFQRPSSVERLSGNMLSRVGQRSWRLASSNETLGVSEVAEYIVQSHVRKSLPAWYLQRTQSVKIAIIRAQRLFDFGTPDDATSDGTSEVKQVVTVYSEDLTKRINETIAKSALQFQTKEKTFPHRILAGEVRAETESVLRSKYIELQKRIATLSEIGLQESSDSLTLPKIKLNPTHRRVLTLYLSDMNEKLDVFNEIYEQITLMSHLLNKKLRRKIFSINRYTGFFLQSTSEDGAQLNPTDLSSGEQHQLAILYKLIFSDAANQLYLVDEPEISLHVEWQRQFSDDLRQIAEARGHQFLIATHSPQIINGRLDLAVPLDGGIPNDL